MGEDLSLDGRDAVRTPMHWDDTPNAGFSSAEPDALFRPVVMTGKFGARRSTFAPSSETLIRCCAGSKT
jgi:maltose alpha-D-glucosyltransferase/alpha-amylase